MGVPQVISETCTLRINQVLGDIFMLVESSPSAMYRTQFSNAARRIENK